MLRVTSLQKSFPDRHGGPPHLIIDVPHFELATGAQVAFRGESGTGKTTFLHLIAGLHHADAGEIWIEGENLALLSEARRDRLRARQIGYIFQTFNLLQGHSALENVMLGMAFGGKADEPRAREMLERVGLKERLHHLPRQLSVGQQQRVALARAVAHRPKLVLADEPTGNLDGPRAREALALLRETVQEVGASLLLVSHDELILREFETCVDFRALNRAAPREVVS